MLTYLEGLSVPVKVPKSYNMYKSEQWPQVALKTAERDSPPPSEVLIVLWRYCIFFTDCAVRQILPQLSSLLKTKIQERWFLRKVISLSHSSDVKLFDTFYCQSASVYELQDISGHSDLVKVLNG